MLHNFISVRSPYLVPFTGRFRIHAAPTSPPRHKKADRPNEEALAESIHRMRKLQARLFASDSRSLLLVFQALDAAGKDGTVKAVMSGIDPSGCQVHAFKRPSEDELDHDFLWRVYARLPERGRIGIFNRSHYEEVLVVRVHPELLHAQRLPHVPRPDKLWKERYESIRDFEKHLARNGTTIVKFFLNVSRDEQKKRFLDRIEDPDANWKFKSADVREREHFDEYQAAYEDALNETSRPWAPWYAVPADDKDFMRRTVSDIIVDTLRQMKVDYPVPSREERQAMADARRSLLEEGGKRRSRRALKR